MWNATAGARRYLSIFGAGTVLVALVYLFAPLQPMARVGIDSLAAPASIDVRATYGGSYIGVGVFRLWSAARASRVCGGLAVMALIVEP